MKAGSRPQYYRIRRMVQMVREGTETGYLPNSSDFMQEFEVSRRTVARDLDFLRDEERAPLAYDDARHGFRLTDETYTLPPVRISRKEAFSFGLARKLLAHYEGTPLHLDMRSVLDKIAESLEGDITIEPDWLSEHVGVMPEDCVRIDPEVWAQIAGFIERREEIRATYQTFDGRISEYMLRPYHLLAYQYRPRRAGQRTGADCRSQESPRPDGTARCDGSGTRPAGQRVVRTSQRATQQSPCGCPQRRSRPHGRYHDRRISPLAEWRPATLHGIAGHARTNGIAI